MAEKTISKGDTYYKSPKEIKEIYSATAEKVNFINEKFDEIQNSTDLEELQKAHQEIYGVRNANGEYEGGKLQELEEAYAEILEDNVENEEFGLKTQIENLLKNLKDTQIKEIDDFILEIEGKTVENEKVPGYRQKLKELYEDYGKKLQGADTALKLAGIFEDKVKEYKKISTNNERIFFYFTLCLSGFLIIISIISLFQGIDIYDKLDSLYPMILAIPFIIWMLVFSGNRRAEAKKLEEAYKHKEVMARAYVGYRETIKDLDTPDNKLLENHMQNLLDTMKTDSSEFLSSKGENHPFLDFLHKFSKKDVKEIKDLLSDFGIDISINKK